jgi:hypothetical protein
MTELVKRPSQKRPSNQRAFIEWIAVKSISFRSVNRKLFHEMVQRMNPDFSGPVYNPLKFISSAWRRYIGNYQSVKRMAIAP